MPGIVVGVDGSADSRRALDWAAAEATLQCAPLTILTVHPMLVNPWTDSPVTFPGDITAQQMLWRTRGRRPWRLSVGSMTGTRRR